MNAIDYISTFQMQPHPEGGFYKETFRSGCIINKSALPEDFSGDRAFSTAIYFLMEKGNFSAFHRIKSDECWHFYAGQTLEVFIIQQNGDLEIIKLGPNILEGETFQYVVPANCWFASRPAAESDFSLVGCTVAPGFDFNDFELAYSNKLVASFPQHASVIYSLCRQ